ncbi:MAG: HupE/UreJ family protein [Thermoanaerobaculia bacterium]
MTRPLQLALLALLVTIPLPAHDIGTTRIDVSFLPTRQYRIAITADGSTLLRQLEMQATPRPLSYGTDPLAGALRSLAPELIRNCNATFDGKLSVPHLESVVVEPQGTVRGATITLAGEVPANATTFTWSYGLAFGTYSLALHNGNEPLVRQWIEGGSVSAPFPLHQAVVISRRIDVIRTYLRLGFTHIVPEGMDHILFVVGIFLLSTRFRDVLMQVTAFTIAHSITLALTMYGIVSLSSRVVEPMIALSIMYVAVENIFTTRVHAWRVALVFSFGLLHGMGFASVLRTLQIPRSEFVSALVSFNAGVEIGQLTVIAAAWMLLAPWARRRDWYHRRVVVPISLAIATTGLYWAIQRIAV